MVEQIPDVGLAEYGLAKYGLSECGLSDSCTADSGLAESGLARYAPPNETRDHLRLQSILRDESNLVAAFSLQ